MTSLFKIKKAVTRILPIILISLILFSIIFLFSPNVISNPDNPSLILFFDGTSTPSGWTDISSDYTNRFIRGNETFGGTGGSSEHTHTGSVTSVSSPSATSGSPGIFPTDGASITHTHTGTATGNASSNLPPFRTLKLIKANGIPATIPDSAIAVFNASCPSGWVSYSEMNGKYPRIDTSVNSTGGSTNHQNQFTVTWSSTSGSTTLDTISGNSYAQTHSHASTDHSTNTTSIEPPYLEVIFCKKDGDGDITNGMIGMFNETLTDSDWDVVSDSGDAFSGKFIKGAVSYGSNGGQESHTHASLTSQTSGAGDTGIDAGGDGTRTATKTHTHTFSITSINSSSNIPEYVNMIFAYYFKVPDTTPPMITIQDPQNTTLTSLTTNFNVSLNENSSTCYYSLNSDPNVTMTNLNNTHFTGLNSTLFNGFYSTYFWCNDTSNNWNQSSLRQFTLDAPCNPDTTTEWIITDNQVCDGKTKIIQGEIKIDQSSGGFLSLINNAYIECEKLFLMDIGEWMYIEDGGTFFQNAV